MKGLEMVYPVGCALIPGSGGLVSFTLGNLTQTLHTPSAQGFVANSTTASQRKAVLQCIMVQNASGGPILLTIGVGTPAASGFPALTIPNGATTVLSLENGELPWFEFVTAITATASAAGVGTQLQALASFLEF